jgi:hypothetical protein
MNLGAACNRARPQPSQNGASIYLKVIMATGHNLVLSVVKISVFEIVRPDHLSP